MKKLLMFFAMVMTSITMMAQSQFYVILKDGSGASYPENIVDSLTFNDENGAKIYGFEDLAKSIAQLRREVDSLKGIMSLLTVDSTSFIHEYVDLGLPSGTLWATCNLGAKKPSDYGYYIYWGETDQRSNYSLSGSQIYDKDIPTMRATGIIDQYFNLTSRYDAATVLWGDDWRMPTSDEINELLRYCDYQWTEVNGSNGIKLTSSKNGHQIFLPCAGMKRDNEDVMVGTKGYYIGATANGDNSACGIYLAQGDVRPSSTLINRGRTIRAVRKRADDRPFVDPNDTTINGHAYIDLGLPSGTLWATHNMGADSVEVGNRYQWGNSTTEIPSEGAALWKGDSLNQLIQYGVTDSTGVLLPNRDAATYSWGGQWRMPTYEECSELLSNCSKEKKTIKGIDGWLLTGPNGKTLFFPITDEQFEFSSCWTSSISPNPNDDDMACMLNIYDTSIIYTLDWADYTYQRDKILPIRPVVNR